MWKVFLTGATGFLGGELATAFSKLDCVDKVACLVRSSCRDEAGTRLERVFAVHQDEYDRKKVLAIPGDLTDPLLPARLRLEPALDDINLVVHAGANTSFLPQK